MNEMKQNLSKTYDPKEIETRLYEKWMKNHYFHAKVDPKKKPFTMIMPPPNITGKLHMGHALDNTLQDILIRFKRMQGYNALWQPGTDHASIATEVKIIEKLKEEGLTKEDIGREAFLERAWKWKEEYGGTILNQLKKLGFSCDWERERFTMDEGCSKAVTEVFVKLYEQGLIYKGERIIHWCPVCHTSISDAEVEHVEQTGSLWYLRYPIVGSKEAITIATTRPETLFGDVAIAVHPEDERYAHLVGKRAMIPLAGREIPIVADHYVDAAFGTGAVKITPAHDPNDFEVGKRHALPSICVMQDDGTMNENAGVYAGLDRYEARKRMIEALTKEQFLIKTEEHVHQVGTHDRCKTVIEPMVKQQWFVKMDELIQPAIQAVKSGEIRLFPDRLKKVYFNWTDHIKDWCISRQLWWGHRIPAYICQTCGEIMVQAQKPESCKACKGKHILQEEDTLDTWFSSALWPFSTLGWPEKTEELDYFYPTDVLVTGYDIIFFWVIRMIFSSYAHKQMRPFHTVVFHGLIRDSLGRKMSKSLGNGIDPLEVVEKYGADALRLTIVTGNAPGNDMRFYWERVEASRNFANKVWNASRFILMHMKEKRKPQEEHNGIHPDCTEIDRFILSKKNTLVKEVTEQMEQYELGIAVQKISDFLWNEFCDWYIEMVKPRLYDLEDPTREAALWTLQQVLMDGLKLLHPYMPFITEEIFCSLCEEPSIMISKWPIFDKEMQFLKAEQSIARIQEAVREIRALRTEKQVAPSKKISLFVTTQKKEIQDIFLENQRVFAALAGAKEIQIQEQEEPQTDCFRIILADAIIWIPSEELVDFEKEFERLKKEEKRLEAELKRVDGMLQNENFLRKAPKEKIAQEQQKQEKYLNMMQKVKEQLQYFMQK